MRGEYRNDPAMDPSGFVLLADYVPHIVQEIRYYSTYNFMETGKELDMGSPFDLFSERSHPDCRDITREQYENRMLLQRVMLRSGFQPIDCEWWHFSLRHEPYPDTYFEFPVSSAYLKRSGR